MLYPLIIAMLMHGSTFTFSESDHGWTVDFADYPAGQEDFFELGWGWENLPLELADMTKGLFLTGNNHSDDLFMYAKRQIGGLRPNTFYDLRYTVLIESNVSSEHSIGIGGSPGSSVFFKAGASAKEPKKMNVNGYFLLNVDKGNQSEAGENALVIGDLSNASPNPYTQVDSKFGQETGLKAAAWPNFESTWVYFPKHLTHTDPLRVQTDGEGKLWVFLGTDSGFEGTTKFYIAKVDLQLDEVENF